MKDCSSWIWLGFKYELFSLYTPWPRRPCGNGQHYIGLRYRQTRKHRHLKYPQHSEWDTDQPETMEIWTYEICFASSSEYLANSWHKLTSPCAILHLFKVILNHVLFILSVMLVILLHIVQSESFWVQLVSLRLCFVPFGLLWSFPASFFLVAPWLFRAFSLGLVGLFTNPLVLADEKTALVKDTKMFTGLNLKGPAWVCVCSVQKLWAVFADHHLHYCHQGVQSEKWRTTSLWATPPLCRCLSFRRLWRRVR